MAFQEEELEPREEEEVEETEEGAVEDPVEKPKKAEKSVEKTFVKEKTASHGDFTLRFFALLMAILSIYLVGGYRRVVEMGLDPFEVTKNIAMDLGLLFLMFVLFNMILKLIKKYL